LFPFRFLLPIAQAMNDPFPIGDSVLIQTEIFVDNQKVSDDTKESSDRFFVGIVPDRPNLYEDGGVVSFRQKGGWQVHVYLETIFKIRPNST
jgi:hypothetical protein